MHKMNLLNKHIDKQLHLLWSCILTLFFSIFLPLHSAVIITFLIGLGKELYDQVKYKGFDIKDLIADIIGISLAIFYLYLTN